jgi:hypothetical protein
MIKSTDMVNTLGKMQENILDTGKMENRMGMGNIL